MTPVHACPPKPRRRRSDVDASVLRRGGLGPEMAVATSVPLTKPASGSAGRYVRAGEMERREVLGLLGRARRTAECRHARTRCEDLTELLGQLASTCDDTGLEATDRMGEVRRLLDEVRADVAEIAFRVARVAAGVPQRPAAGSGCAHCNDRSCRASCIAVDDVPGLERVVELLDERLRDLARGFSSAPRLALELASALVAGTSALAAPLLHQAERRHPLSPSGVAMHPTFINAPGPLHCAHCGQPCDPQEETGLAACSTEHLLLARILGSGDASLAPATEGETRVGVAGPAPAAVPLWAVA